MFNKNGVSAWIAKSEGKKVEWKLMGLDWQELTDKEFLSWDNSRFVSEDSDYFFSIVEDNKMLGNYKIRVNNEAESKEVQELFGRIGYKLGAVANKHFPVMVVAHDCGYGPISTTATHMNHENHKDYKEITLTQLRDMVSAHRKPEKGLISGVEALRALVDGEDVQGSLDLKLWANAREYGLDEFLNHNTSFKFRLKPRTITLNVEIPAPFEPKEGEEFFILAPLSVTGYTKVQGITTQVLLDEYVKLGAWRTEEEIKQVVAALRGAICKK